MGHLIRGGKGTQAVTIDLNKGVATPLTNPGTPLYNVYYMASEPGTYTYFDGLQVSPGEIAMLKYSASTGSWSKDIIKSDVGTDSNNYYSRLNSTMLLDDDRRYRPDIDGMKNTLIHRICLNPFTGNLFIFFRVGADHVSYPAKIYGRKSTDGGKTWAGMDGTGTESVVIEETDYDLRNNGVCVTPTGRIVIFYMRYYQSSAWHDTKYVYSDDDGDTWSEPVVFTDPPSYAAENSSAPVVMCNRCFVHPSGDIYVPYHYSKSAGGMRVILAKSEDNGATWDTEAIVACDTTNDDTKYSTVEIMGDDFGDGVWILVARCGTAYSGIYVPMIMTSQDYGQHWAGNERVTLTGEDLEDMEYCCGPLDIFTDGGTLGTGLNYNIPIPDIICMEILGIKWLVILVWVRDDGDAIQTTLLMSLIPLDRFLLDYNGVEAIVHGFAYTLLEGTNHGGANKNGGNGSSQRMGTGFFHVTYEQKTATPAGNNDVHVIPVTEEILTDAAYRHYDEYISR